MMKANIGIIVDFRFENENGGYSQYAYYAIRENIVNAFKDSANVFMLPHDKSAASTYIDMVDGIVLTGSIYNIDPFYYKEPKRSEYLTDNRRADFEFSIIRKAIDKNIPILGLGGGMQMINVYFGGTMYQDVETQVSGGINHVQKSKGLRWHQVYHDNVIVADTKLAGIIGDEILPVNSTHTQAVKEVGKDLLMNAYCKDDNVVEGIEAKDKDKWIIGLEWRPEYVFSREKPENEREKKIFDAFIIACEKQKKD